MGRGLNAFLGGALNSGANFRGALSHLSRQRDTKIAGDLELLAAAARRRVAELGGRPVPPQEQADLVAQFPGVITEDLGPLYQQGIFQRPEMPEPEKPVDPLDQQYKEYRNYRARTGEYPEARPKPRGEGPKRTPTQQAADEARLGKLQGDLAAVPEEARARATSRMRDIVEAVKARVPEVGRVMAGWDWTTAATPDELAEYNRLKAIAYGRMTANPSPAVASEPSSEDQTIEDLLR